MQLAHELATNGERTGEHHRVRNVQWLVVENPEPVWVEKVRHGEDVRWRPLDHRGREAGVVAVLHDVEARVGGSHYGNGLAN